MAVLAALAALLLVVATLGIVMVTPPQRLAGALRRAGPIALIVGGAGLMLAGRAAIGVPLLGFGLALYRRIRHRAPPDLDEGASSSSSSTVRAEWLKMILDHGTGDLDGTVLKGTHASATLSSLSEDALRDLRTEVSADPDSLRLLEAYLDRRIAGWRAHAQAGADDGLGGSPGSGPMTEKQAYEILGLEPGATVAEIRDAHRRLMKRVHPDHGGTDFLAARINEAKAFLVERHR